LDDDEAPVKLFYRIGEVSHIVGVEPHVLRYWETEFRSIRPQKSRKGQRIYSRRDVEKLLKVKDLLYTHGFTIAGARKRLRESGVEPQVAEDPSHRNLGEARRVLLDVRKELVEMLAEIEHEPIALAGSANAPS
jgi:DNA-binding transcriptional MerR regulator